MSPERNLVAPFGTTSPAREDRQFAGPPLSLRMCVLLFIDLNLPTLGSSVFLRRALPVPVLLTCIVDYQRTFGEYIKPVRLQASDPGSHKEIVCMKKTPRKPSILAR
jgi:hypothetical protein